MCKEAINEADIVESAMFTLDNGKISFLSDLGEAVTFSDTEVTSKVKALYFSGKKQVFKHWMGDFELNTQVLADLVTSFKSKVLRKDLAVNYDHNGGKAAGWIKDLNLKDGNTLEAEIEWTPSARDMIKNKEYKYFSSEFVLGDFKDSETEDVHKNVFTGGALTNYPFLRKAKVALSEKKGVNKMEKEELIVALRDEHKIDIVMLQDSITKLTSELGVKVVELEEAKKELNDFRLANEKEKMDFLLANLIKEGKSTQALNDDVYAVTFNAIGYAKAVELAQKMPIIVKTVPEGSGTATSLSESEQLDSKIKSYAQEHKLSYAEALDKIVFNKKGE